MAKEIQRRLLEILYPPRCLMCDRAVSYGEGHGNFDRSVRVNLCGECFEKLKLIEGPICFVCGRPVDANSMYCGDCSKIKHEFVSGRFPLSYESIAKSIYRFKYNNRPAMAEDFAAIIFLLLKDWIEYIKPDAFIPVPLHKKRFRKRGYNQAAELSKALSKLALVPTYENYVTRVKNTDPQKIFDRKGRQINVKKAFIVPENDVKLKTVVVVDDIFTTGSTIDAISRELKLHGVQEVYFITISAAGT